MSVVSWCTVVTKSWCTCATRPGARQYLRAPWQQCYHGTSTGQATRRSRIAENVIQKITVLAYRRKEAHKQANGYPPGWWAFLGEMHPLDPAPRGVATSSYSVAHYRKCSWATVTGESRARAHRSRKHTMTCFSRSQFACIFRIAEARESVGNEAIAMTS